MAEATQQDLAGVIESSAAGDDVAFARIVAANHEDMRRVCAVVCGDDAIAVLRDQARNRSRWDRPQWKDGVGEERTGLPADINERICVHADRVQPADNEDRR